MNKKSEDRPMKDLSNLSPAPGSNKKNKRIGRGIGSGHGKTAGKGHKGQKARSGGKVRPGFEGGQMPLYRRLPKRGFKNPFRIEYNVVNLDIIARFDEGTKITPELLGEIGILKNKTNPIKVLGRGVIEKKYEIVTHKISANAKEAIEKAGGTVEILVVGKK